MLHHRTKNLQGGIIWLYVKRKRLKISFGLPQLAPMMGGGCWSITSIPADAIVLGIIMRKNYQQIGYLCCIKISNVLYSIEER